MNGNKFSIITLMFVIILFFATCEYDEAVEDEANKNKGFRISSVEVTGDITEINSETYTYNENGLLVEIIRKDNDGNPLNSTTYDYNDEGVISRETFTDLSVEPTQIIKTVNVYEDGKKVSSESKDMVTNIILSQSLYYYDTSGRLVKKEVKEPSGALIGEINFNYENEPARGEGKELTEYTLSKQ